MSNALRVPATEARPLAQALVERLQDVCTRIEIAGSLRRRKADVGDIEIVALPKHRGELLARLDMLVYGGEAAQAVYSDGKRRWGDKYRGLSWRGMRAEIFVADQDNFGYALWLRTGPADANHYVMNRLYAHAAPFRFTDGYAADLATGERIPLPNEHAVFALFGIPYITPEHRTYEIYARHLHTAPRWGTFTTVQVAARPVQAALF